MDKGLAAPPMEFIDLKAQRLRLGDRIDRAVARVIDHGGYIMGPEVAEFERQMAAFSGVKHAISCANGTDALALGLMAVKARPGDAIFVPSFTFAATAEVVAWLGATPVFVDVLPDTFNMDPASLRRGIETAKAVGLNPRMVIPVDLFGLPADYAAIEAIAAEHNLMVMCDAAQGYGATYHGRNVGQIGTMTTTSFFPAKPLGCYGDGGAIFTDDDGLADIIKSLRVHGKGTDKYDNVRIGMNGRLDTIQAAILIEKLSIYPDEIEKRQVVARRYNEGLAAVARVPHVPEGLMSVWAQYTLVIDTADRDAVAAALKKAGVPTAVYYPKPLHQQTAYKHFPVAGNGLPVCEGLAKQVLSLPMHPYLDEAAQGYIIQAVRSALA